MRFIIFISFIFAFVNLTIPTSFGDLKVFSEEMTTVTLNDYVHYNLNDFTDVSTDEESNEVEVEVEEVKKEFITTDSLQLFSLFSYSQSIFSKIPVFISTYIFSLFIPPAL